MSRSIEQESADRVPCDEEYLRALGRAVYNFASLEGQLVALWYLVDVPSAAAAAELTAAQIIDGFRKSVRRSELPADLKQELERWAKGLHELREQRNDILHAHPYTEDDGSQRLWRRKKGRSAAKSPDDLYAMAARFAEASSVGNDLYYNRLVPLIKQADTSELPS